MKPLEALNKTYEFVVNNRVALAAGVVATGVVAGGVFGGLHALGEALRDSFADQPPLFDLNVNNS